MYLRKLVYTAYNCYIVNGEIKFTNTTYDLSFIQCERQYNVSLLHSLKRVIFKIKGKRDRGRFFLKVSSLKHWGERMEGDFIKGVSNVGRS